MDIGQLTSQKASIARSLTQSSGEDTLEFIVFTLADEEYAVSINDVKEIIRKEMVTPVPNVPPFIAGILNLRGEIVVVVDLKKQFDLPVTSSEHHDDHSYLIVAHTDDTDFGLIADSLKEVLRVPKNAVQPPLHLTSTKIPPNYIKGIVTPEFSHDEETGTPNSRSIILLDLIKILQQKEWLGMKESDQCKLPNYSAQPLAMQTT